MGAVTGAGVEQAGGGVTEKRVRISRKGSLTPIPLMPVKNQIPAGIIVSFGSLFRGQEKR